jgi:hypothetical protein
MPGHLLPSLPENDLALDTLEPILVQLLRMRGFEGGSFEGEELTLEELAARDGGLPLFLAQAAAWADLMAVPWVVAPFDLAADESSLTRVRAVTQLDSADPKECVIRGPLLLFMNHAVHLARGAGTGNRLALESLVQPPQPKICHALSVRSWPTPRAP